MPLFFRSEHEITETKAIKLQEEGEVVHGWQAWDWPHCVVELLEQVEHDSPKILDQTHSELVRIMPGEYDMQDDMIERYFQPMSTATEQEQQVLTDRLLALYDCRPTNKPRTWVEAIRLKCGDVTTFQPNEPQVQQAAGYSCKPRSEYEYDGSTGGVRTLENVWQDSNAHVCTNMQNFTEGAHGNNCGELDPGRLYAQ